MNKVEEKVVSKEEYEILKKEDGSAVVDGSINIYDIEENFDISLLNRETIAFKDGDNIKKINLKNLKDEVIAGNLHPNTIVFNNLIESKKDYVNIWETSASKTWLKRFLVN